jgi:glyoxylase-like metal-dependent hydrolase (beta-lactamase superfamily II)
MCGFHHATGQPGHRGPIFRPRIAPRVRSRRAFIGEFGKGTLALAVLTPVLAACSGDGSSSEGDTTAGSATDATAGADLRWGRANLGFVSAYVLARGNQAAIIDTGVEGSADAIGETLASMGLLYDDVDHVILTHKHGDHAGSIAAVVERAAGAEIYAGQADLDEIDAEAIVALVGGEDVFGLEILATPGHTEGHVAVIDHDAGLLVAGDALFTEGGGVVEGPEQFFDDIPTSRDSIRQLAALSFNTLLVGHGEPIEAAADTAVADLAASVP